MKTEFGIFIVTAAALCIFTTSQAAHIQDTQQGIQTDEKIYCTDERDPNFKLAAGEQGPGPRGTCMLVKCEGVVDGKPVLTAIGCGVFVATAGCKATSYDKTKLYPDCCPSEVC
ncbi:PREDICTED: uncharacterized protein LOC108560814 [Nicrophorus vespilloides]|uniref:Uncharacterized protein LOC108560814 n=1 Tax=Nicrophorus vespilloides TaxID=110193 RepID=A0ABM1MHE7_NICVS|nr:PREDICTED: uncharacterized protein LOC108560814 [Nicrophorus vespilloides]